MFTIHEGSRETLANVERNIGFIPNLAAAIAASPTALERLRRPADRAARAAA